MFRHEYAGLSIFNGLDSSQVHALSPYLEEILLAKGETVFEQGTPACCLYILLKGEVLVRYKPYDGPALTVAHIQPGGVFGWSAALGREDYTSSAMAVSDGFAYRLRAANLQRLYDHSPEAGKVILERLAGSIAERLRNSNNSILEILSQGLDLKGSEARRSGIHER